MTRPYYLTWNRQAEAGTLPVESAECDEFILSDGRRIYDFLSTSFQTNFGHDHSGIKDKIHRQLDSMPIASPKAEFELKESVSNRLLSLLGKQDGRLFYTVSGAEAVENALKITRQIKGTKKILARQKSYHGASLGALSVTGDWRNLPHYTCDQATVRIPEPHEDRDLKKTRRAVERLGADRVAGVILETITGANGVIIPDEGWYKGIQEMCRQYDMFLILDEVLCGFGRTGKPFAFQHYEQLQPDMICMSKAITGGYIPFGAMWTSPSIADHYQDKVLSCGLTNYGHPLGLAALDGVLDLFDSSAFLDNVRELETIFQQQLVKLKQSRPNVKEVRIKGLLAAIEFDSDSPTWEQGIQEGLHFYSKHNMNVLAPPLISTPQRLTQALDEYLNLAASYQHWI